VTPEVAFPVVCGKIPGSLAVFDRVRPELLTMIADRICARSGSESFPSLSDGGWKSPPTVFEWGGVFDELRATLTAHLAGRVPVGWAMINAGGSSHPRRQHYRTKISGIYYVTGGEPPLAPTIFETPGGLHGDEIAIDPAPGRLVLFPGDLWHRVPEVRGAKPRITIAFDVRG
jgi:hypothetical protein